MKRIFGILTAAIVISAVFSAAMVCKADERISITQENFQNEPDIVEITALFQVATDVMNEIISAENSAEATELLDISDIDTAKMYKVYYNVPDILDKNLHGNAVIEYLKSGRYYWVLPIFKNDQIHQIEISKGFPLSDEALNRTDGDGNRILTEEQTRQIKESAEKWGINSYAANITRDDAGESLKACGALLDRPGIGKPVNNTLYYIAIPQLHTPGAMIVTEDRNYFKLFRNYPFDDADMASAFVEEDVVIGTWFRVKSFYDPNHPDIAGVIGYDNVNPATADAGGCHVLYIKLLIFSAAVTAAGIVRFLKKCRAKAG